MHAFYLDLQEGKQFGKRIFYVWYCMNKALYNPGLLALNAPGLLLNVPLIVCVQIPRMEEEKPDQVFNFFHNQTICRINIFYRECKIKMKLKSLREAAKKTFLH